MYVVFNQPSKTKPPLSQQFSAAEVREQTKLDNQEQVLMVQLEKLDGKLEAKLKEVQDGTKPQRPKAKSPALANRKKSDAIQTPVESVVSKYNIHKSDDEASDWS